MVALLVGGLACSETPEPVREVDIAQTFFDAGMQHQHPLFGEDFTQAAESFRKAAEHGHTEAMSQLGYYYLEGQGVPQDSVEAMKWFEQSAAHGNPGGCASIGTMYAKGNGVPQDGVKAVAFYHKALEHGDRNALLFLATLYTMGEAVPRDWVESYKWTYLNADYGGPISRTSASETWDGCFESLLLTPRQCETARGRARGWLREQGDSFPARSPVAQCGSQVEAVDDGIEAERATESEPEELSLADRITQDVERMPDLIARCRAMNPAVRLDTLEATQRGTDLVIHGAGRNEGDCALGGFKVRASEWGEIDGVGVRVDGQSTSIVELEEAFTFELYFYDTAKRGAPITVWFVLDDLADFVQDNDRLVHSAVGLNLLAPRIVLQ